MQSLKKITDKLRLLANGAAPTPTPADLDDIIRELESFDTALDQKLSEAETLVAQLKAQREAQEKQVAEIQKDFDELKAQAKQIVPVEQTVDAFMEKTSNGGWLDLNNVTSRTFRDNLMEAVQDGYHRGRLKFNEDVKKAEKALTDLQIMLTTSNDAWQEEKSKRIKAEEENAFFQECLAGAREQIENIPTKEYLAHKKGRIEMLEEFREGTLHQVIGFHAVTEQAKKDHAGIVAMIEKEKNTGIIGQSSKADRSNKPWPKPADPAMPDLPAVESAVLMIERLKLIQLLPGMTVETARELAGKLDHTMVVYQHGTIEEHLPPHPVNGLQVMATPDGKKVESVYQADMKNAAVIEENE